MNVYGTFTKRVSIMWGSRLAVVLAFVLAIFIIPAEAQTWTLLAPSGPPPTGRGFHGVRSVYNPTSNRMVFFGGWEGGGGVYDGNRNDTWVLTNANGLGGAPQWIQLLPQGNLPLPRSGNSSVYDPASNRMIVFGGCDGGCFPTLNDVWVLTNADGLGGTPAWIPLPTSGGGPAPRTDHTAVYDESSNTMIVFGGQNGGGYGCSTYSDIWVLSNANGLGGTATWTQLASAGGPPPGQYGPTAVYDPATNQMTVFGGAGIVNGICQDSNATWTLSNANGKGGTPVWTNLTPEGAAGSPMARAFHTAIYDPVTNRMTIFGGGASADFNDVWILTSANGSGGTPTWVQISPAGTLPVARDSQAAFLDDANNRMVMFGGSTSAGPLNDVWVLTNENGLVGTQLQISSVQPNHGGNAGSVSPNIIGSGFQAGAQVKLIGPGPDIIASGLVVSDSGTLIQATFDLTGAATGARDLVVTNSDGTSTSLTSAFTVDQGGSPLISVQIIGRSLIRFDKSATYYLALSNTGSVDSPPSIASLELPVSVQFNQSSGSDLVAVGSTSSPDVPIPSASSSATVTLLFASKGVPAGGANSAPFNLTLPSLGSNPQFTLTGAWQPNLLSLTFNDYLLARGAPYIPFVSSCSQCYAQGIAQVNAITDAQTAYTAYQVAESNKTFGAANLAFTIASTLVPVEKAIVDIANDPLLPQSAKDSFALLGNNLLSQASTASGLLTGDNPGPILQQLALTNSSLILRASLLLPGASVASHIILDTMLAKLNDLLAVLASANSYIDLVNVAQAARAKFFPLFDAYLAARSAYRNCLAQSCMVIPGSPTPPTLPVTTLPVSGVGSLDPNDKVGLPGAEPQRYVSGAAPFSYSIYFANEDTATAPAQQVMITDQLDTVRDDLSTFRFGPITFGNQLIPSPPPGQTNLSTTLDLRPANNILVAATAKLNASTGLLTWNFQSLDPSTGLPPSDPTAGFLPPGVGGSTFFTIAPMQSMSTNTQVQNQATIVFDTNAPINTPIWINTLDSTPPLSHVGALPSIENSSSFPVQWTGTDVGAGIQDFTVYVSDSGGPFTAFQTNTVATSATFTGQAGHAYAFYSIARDLVGNVEASKTVAEATTQVGVDFSAFTANVEFTTGHRPGFEVRGSLSLGSGTSAIALESQVVTLALGPYSVTIPAGSFRKREERSYEFEGKINGVRLQFQIVHAGENNYKFRAEGTGVNLAGFSNPVTVQFLIGGNGGTTQVTAKIQVPDRDDERDRSPGQGHQ